MFTNTIKLIASSSIAGSSVSKNFVIKYTYTKSYGAQYLGIGDTGAIDVTAWTTTISLLAEPSSYSSVTATYYLDGKADDEFRFYLNDDYVKTVNFGVDPYFQTAKDPIYVTRGQTSFNLTLNKKSNSFAIHVYSYSGMWYGYIYSSSVTITTISK